MKTSDIGIDLIKSFEGLRTRPYRCEARLWTIGYGHVLYPEQNNLKLNDRDSFQLKPADDREFTTDEIDDLLRSDLDHFERGVLGYCPGSADCQKHFDALVSFCFNLGVGSLQSSTLRQKYNRGDFEGAAGEFLKWTKAAGKVLPGLVRRRQAESLLFMG